MLDLTLMIIVSLYMSYFSSSQYVIEVLQTPY
jgi:hypothetical protein